MPTGAGKSVCFQIPALMLQGVTIVVSPLISLMKDQVGALTQNGVKAAYLNGSLTEKQIALAISRAEKGAYKIIYVAPERLNTKAFLALCRKIEIPLVCVDEAHCVSQWGQDFRPSYRLIRTFVSSLEKRPVLCAMTATATQRVREDIIRFIGLENPQITVLSFDRPNLYFGVCKPKSKQKELLRCLDDHKGESTIIYCSSRKRTDALYFQLKDEGYSVARYHAGMTAELRRYHQDRFIKDECEIMVATNAFGMGIDKSNVSLVIHYNMPGDLESYYQEAGRAGRDGCKAECILFYNASDVTVQKYFIDNPEENLDLSPKDRQDIRLMRLAKLDDMISYATTGACLRKRILAYFGQELEEDCGNCSVCLEKKKKKTVGKTAAKKNGSDDGEYDEELYQRLRALRMKLAKQSAVPAFVVFSDATLKSMAHIRPQNREQFLTVSGVGEYKCKTYGAVFVKEICKYLSGECEN